MWTNRHIMPRTIICKFHVEDADISSVNIHIIDLDTLENVNNIWVNSKANLNIGSILKKTLLCHLAELCAVQKQKLILSQTVVHVLNNLQIPVTTNFIFINCSRKIKPTSYWKTVSITQYQNPYVNPKKRSIYLKITNDCIRWKPC